MNTYYTKCGRKFAKSAKADTTGYHITEQPEQGPKPGNIVNTECANCPFVVDVKEGWPKQVHKRFECRAGSKPPNHTNDWQGSLSDKCTIQILSLRHDFCEAVIAYCRDHPFLAASYTQDRPDCRRSVSVSCSQNNSGIAAKKDLIAKFFPLKENTDMGKMSAINIMDAMKKAKQKTDTLKFAPHPEDLPLASLQPNPHNTFAEQDDTASIEDMRAGIERIGLINPLAVNHTGGKYYILSGERRYHALVEINRENPEKYSYIRCSVYENLSFAEEMQVLYEANLKVRHYDAAQRLKYFQQLKDTLTAEKAAGRYDGPIQADIAAIMGVTDRQVRKYDQINGELDDTEKQQIAAGKISVDAAAKVAASRRQEKRAGKTGSPSGQQPDMSFWTPYIRDFFLHRSQAELEMLLAYYRQEARPEKEAAACIKNHFGNMGGAGWKYSDGNGCGFSGYGGKFQLDVIIYSKDGQNVTKRHRAIFTWTQVEKVVRQMVIDGSIVRQLRVLGHNAQENTPGTTTPKAPEAPAKPSATPSNTIPQVQDAFLQSISGIDLTDDERRTVNWLKDCEWRTLSNLTSIIQKLRGR